VSETKFRHAVRDKLKAQFTIAQIESHQTAPGVPDTHLLLNDQANHTNKTCWLELKFEEKLPTRIDLRKTQVPWLRKYYRSGGKCWVVLKVGCESKIYVWAGSYAKELYDGKNIFYQPNAWFDTRRGGWKEFLDYIKREITK